MSRFNANALKEASKGASLKTATQKISEIKLSLIEPNPYQPRNFEGEEDLEELIASIRHSGLLQPISIAKYDKGYVIVGGHRRYYACKSLEMETITAHLVEADNAQLMSLSLVENIQRKNLSTIEEAIALDNALNSKEWKNQQALAMAIGKPDSYVSNVLSVLTLQPSILSDMQAKKHKIGLSILAELQKIGHDEELQMQTYTKVIAGEYKRDDVREVVKRSKQAGAPLIDSLKQDPSELSDEQRRQPFTSGALIKLEAENYTVNNSKEMRLKLDLDFRTHEEYSARSKFMKDLHALMHEHGFNVGLNDEKDSDLHPNQGALSLDALEDIALKEDDHSAKADSFEDLVTEDEGRLSYARLLKQWGPVTRMDAYPKTIQVVFRNGSMRDFDYPEAVNLCRDLSAMQEDTFILFAESSDNSRAYNTLVKEITARWRVNHMTGFRLSIDPSIKADPKKK